MRVLSVQLLGSANRGETSGGGNSYNEPASNQPASPGDIPAAVDDLPF